MLCKLRYPCRSTPDRTDTHWNDDAAPPILKATETNRLAVLEAYHQPGCRLPDSEGKPDFMEKFVLSEIAGKKAAIHAYDGIVWKIRSGFLTLTFGGWAIMLQSLAGRDQAPHDYKPLVWGLYLFSLGFTLGAWFVDRSYIQRKFRVIITLDRLTEVLTARGGDCSGIPADLLIIAGDNAIKPYDCAGYRNALKAESVVYLAPLTVIFAVVFWLL